MKPKHEYITNDPFLAALIDGTIKVKSNDECAKANLHVCSDVPTGLKNEQESVCSECGKPVWFTNVFPPTGPVPRKVCFPCAMELGRGEQTLSA